MTSRPKTGVGTYVSSPQVVLRVHEILERLSGATPMTKSDRSVCFLTQVSGELAGGREGIAIVEKDGKWRLTGWSKRRDLRAKAICIGAPDDSW